MAVGMGGYSFGVYRSLADATVIILSIRSSAGGLTTKDWTDDDLSIGLRKLPDRTNDAVIYATRTASANQHCSIMVTGHSLGGFIAQYGGVGLSLPFVTFNAPPALKKFGGKFPGGLSSAGFKEGLNYRVNYDPVSLAPGKHVGPLVTLPLAGLPHKSAHTSSTVINSVKQSGFAAMAGMHEISRHNVEAGRGVACGVPAGVVSASPTSRQNC
jgi:hypothetical protein